MEFDAKECLYGLLGGAGDDEDNSDCEWATYYIDHPFWEKDYFEESYYGDILANECGDIPWYD